MRLAFLICNLIFAVLIANSDRAVAAPPQRIYHIMVINSLRHSIVWTPESISQFVHVLLDARKEGEEIELHMDLMETKQPVMNKQYFDSKYRQLAHQYEKLRLNLIVCIGPEALSFLLERGNSFFPRVPVLFGGVGMGEASRARQNPLFEGIAADWNLKENIKLALGLFPETQRIVFVHDKLALSRQLTIDALSFAPEFPRVDFNFITDSTMPEVLGRIQRLPNGSLLFVGPFSTEKNGKMSNPDTGMRQIIAASPIPAFTLWKGQCSAGIVGGLLIDEGQYGRTLANSALSVLRAGSIKGAKIPQTSPAVYVFDWQQMQRHNPAARALPAKYTIINKPRRFIEAYRNQILGALALLIVLTGLVITLSVNTIRRKKAEEALRSSKERLNLVLGATADGIWDWDIQTNSLYCSPRCYTMLGYSPGEIPPVVTATHDLIHPEDAGKVSKALTDHLEGATPGYEVEYRIKAKDGSWRWVLGMGAIVTRDSTGKPLRMAGTLTDITQRKKAEQERLEFEKMTDDQKRQFYRETIISVTGGKLEVCEYQEIDEFISYAELGETFSSAEESSTARKAVEEYLLRKKLKPEKASLFIMGVGEAITNAIKHATSGAVYAGANDEGVWAVVRDEGPGIESLLIPRMVLLQGYSTKPSLGIGYSIMLDVADRILLATGQYGTAILLMKYFADVPLRLLMNQDPKAWGD